MVVVRAVIVRNCHC